MSELQPLAALPANPQRSDVEERLSTLRSSVGRGPSGGKAVTVPPLASDEVKAAAEKFRDLQRQAIDAYQAAQAAHSDAATARQARVQARAQAAFAGKSVKKADLSHPSDDVNALIEEGEALCAARDQARAEVVKVMEADNAAWKARNVEQIAEAKADLSEHLEAAEEAFDRLSASAHLQLWLEGRSLAAGPSADIANGYIRRGQKVELFPGRAPVNVEQMFDSLRTHFAFDGVEHPPVGVDD